MKKMFFLSIALLFSCIQYNSALADDHVESVNATEGTQEATAHEPEEQEGQQIAIPRNLIIKATIANLIEEVNAGKGNEAVLICYAVDGALELRKSEASEDQALAHQLLCFAAANISFLIKDATDGHANRDDVFRFISYLAQKIESSDDPEAQELAQEFFDIIEKYKQACQGIAASADEESESTSE